MACPGYIFRALVVVICFFIYLPYTQGQPEEKVDSLLKVIDSGVTDRQKVDAYNELANLIHAADSAQTISYADQAIELARQIQYQEGAIDGLYMKAALSRAAFFCIS